ncbi:MAG TPA: ATP-grasp domain-containing protein [Myxococcaceae bacterium]|nr:ATP-grasp domain-containing protein [Myxococcaceae bacterium]
MPLPPLKLAVLHYQPRGETMDPVVQHILNALKELGHTSVDVAVHDRVFDILTEVERSQCDLVFNVCETFADDYRMEVNVAALMEMERIRYTGSGTAGLLLAQDKILTKQLLEYHEVKTPHFATFDGETFEAHGRLRFPLIVKPARSDASLGIGRHSVVKDWDELTKRVREIRKEFQDEALAEEYIEGRELYVGVIGQATRPEILPVVELDWGRWDPQKPKVSDREVKFGPDVEGSPRLVIAQNISDELRARIERAALLTFRALKLRDYARIDFRLSAETGEPYLLEANPNPYLESQSELAMAAAHRGLSYPQLISRILESAVARYRLLKKPVAPTVEPKPAEGLPLPEPEPVKA